MGDLGSAGTVAVGDGKIPGAELACCRLDDEGGRPPMSGIGGFSSVFASCLPMAPAGGGRFLPHKMRAVTFKDVGAEA